MTNPTPMSALAQRWSELALADVPLGGMATRAARESGSLLREPATEEQVREVEARLGRRLPPSYREFLLVSDGAFGDLYGATCVYSEDGFEEAPPESSVVGVGLLPVADLRWLRDAHPATAALYAGIGGPCEPVTHDFADPWPWAPFADGLVIDTDKAPGQTCLVPFAGLEEWQVWNIHKETSEAYVSFRSFLEYQVALREPIESVDELRAVIERASSGDYVATRRLSRTTAPDAVPVLAELVDPRFGVQPALGLGRIGTPEAIAALVRLLPAGVEEALALAGTDQARDVLADWGEFHLLSLLGDVRGAEIAASRLVEVPSALLPGQVNSAVRVLGRAGDPRFVEPLLALVPDDDWTELGIAHALARLGAPEGRERLDVLARGDGPMKRAARLSLERLERGRLP
ncbi:MAG: SMI1/KNR4 family protein [Cellulomonas sp.]